MTVTRATNKKIALGLYGSSDDRVWYPISPQSRFNQLFVFARKQTYGDATRDSDDYISSFIQGDWSGGGQVEELNEGAEIARFWWSTADTRSPNQATLGPLVTSVRPNSNCTKCYPLEVGNDGVMYHAFNESGTWKVWGFNESTDAFDYNGGTGVALGSEPAGKAVRFDGVIYVPRGSSGYTRITGSAGTPTCTTVAGSADPSTASPTSAPRPNAFAVFQQKLWALTAEGGIASHSIAQKDAGANAWFWPYGDTTTDFPHVEATATPKALIAYFDKSGVESLYAVTDRGAVIFDDNHPRFIETPIQYPPHPDFGRASAVWRPGEDLWLGAGLDVVRYTSANVVVPLSGLARDHGLPQEYRGSIVDLEPEISCLYAMVGGVSDTATSVAYSLKFGTNGTGNTNFDNPGQIARDSSGNIYVADTANNRLKKHDSGGAYVSSITSLTGISGVCVDSSNNVYVTTNTPGGYTIKKYNSSLSLQWTSVDIGDPLGYLVTDSTTVFYTHPGLQFIGKVTTAAGALSGDFGSFGTGDGQFNNGARGIAYDGTHLYIVDFGNKRVQKFTTAGVFVAKWGTSGTGDGQFQTPVGIAVNPVNGNILVTDSGRDDVQEFTSGGSFVRKFSTSGSGDGQTTDPTGIVVTADGTGVYVADTGNDRVTKFAYSTTTSQLSAYPSLHAWTGIGWHGLWKNSTTANLPTWMKVASATSGYKLWWGMDDGYARFMELRRTIHNPRQGFIAGVDKFAASSEIITGKFDAAMLGFDKVASHVVVFTRSATATESITVEFAVDDGGWEPLGTVTATGKTVLEFDVDGTFSKGRQFNWIQFRLTMARGSTTTNTPVLDSISMYFVKVPQNTVSHTLEIPLNRKFMGRTPAEMYEDLTNLVTSGEMLSLVIGRDASDSDGNVRSAVRRCLPTSISGITDAGTAMTKHVSLTLIEVRTGA